MSLGARSDNGDPGQTRAGDDLSAPANVTMFKSRRTLGRQARVQQALFSHPVTAGLDRIGQIGSAPRPLRPTAEPRDIDPRLVPPDISLMLRLGAADCLRLGLLPWRQIGGATVVLSSRPDQTRRHLSRLQGLFGAVRMAGCTEAALQSAVLMAAAPALAAVAEARVPARDSCRTWNQQRTALHAAIALLAVVGLVLMAPQLAFALVLGWACLTLVLCTALKAVAGCIMLQQPPAPEPADAPVLARLPVVSILVPLYREREIARHLLARLARLDYPSDLLDICLILEDDDDLTRVTLDQIVLPPRYQVIEVPKGTLRTKPRALNYALDFARGSIIGIYDAEDAPAPDQINKVVRRFAQLGPDVACLQGVLDYYNTSSNWLARCFTLEYATWFRVVLPGLQRLGLVVPLGGTTLFLRRPAIEQVGGWDAHNVTEDADLGLRLARHGFRTELIDTVTEEEANARVLPWINQRSRWLKGYAITWAVHMRNPVRLWRDLGAWRFAGVQVLFLGTLSQFVLAPLLWSFWIIPLGLPHPVQTLLPSGAVMALGIGFLMSELIGIAVACLAARRAGKPFLMIWTPTLQVYFILASFAVYKALLEIVTRPYYWHKTVHGIYPPDHPLAAPVTAPPAPLPRQVSIG